MYLNRKNTFKYTCTSYHASIFDTHTYIHWNLLRTNCSGFQYLKFQSNETIFTPVISKTVKTVSSIHYRRHGHISCLQLIVSCYNKSFTFTYITLSRSSLARGRGGISSLVIYFQKKFQCIYLYISIYMYTYEHI